MINKNHTYRITAFFLGLLMFFTSTGFSIDTHYCGGKFKSLSFFGKASTCHEQEKSSAPTCLYHQAMDEVNENGVMSKRDCCENKTQYFQLDQDQQNITLVASTSKFTFWLIAVFPIVLFKDINFDSPISFPFDHSPPLILRDIYALFEAFLL